MQMTATSRYDEWSSKMFFFKWMNAYVVAEDGHFLLFTENAML